MCTMYPSCHSLLPYVLHSTGQSRSIHASHTLCSCCPAPPRYVMLCSRCGALQSSVERSEWRVHTAALGAGGGPWVEGVGGDPTLVDPLPARPQTVGMHASLWSQVADRSRE